MAAQGEEDVEYESDPEEANQLLARRRRKAASDDEDSEGEGAAEREEADPNNVDPIQSDESDGQGGAEDYEEDEEEYLDDDEEIYDEGEELIDGRQVNGEAVGGFENDNVVGVSGKKNAASGAYEGAASGAYEGAAEELEGVHAVDGEENPAEGEEKPVNEPYSVPTAGAFYMHDDRFRDNAGARQRLTFGGRKLWESKDERKWGHDKFEEMTMQERHPDERRRSSRGRTRGRGRNRGVDRGDYGYGRGNRSKPFDDNNAGTPTNTNNQAQMARSFRGRGPKRYEASSFRKSNQAFPRQNKPFTKPPENTSRNTSGQSFATSSNMESDSAPARKHAFGSNLNSASPPFYPSSSATKDIAVSHKKGVESGNATRNSRAPSSDNNFVPQSNALPRGKNIANSMGMEKLTMDGHSTVFSGKPFTPVQSAPSGSYSVNSSQPQARGQGRGAVPVTGHMSYQQTFPPAQISRTSQLLANTSQRGPPLNRGQPSMQTSAQSLRQRPGNGSQDFSPPRTSPSVNSYEAGESDSPSESSKSKVALVGKGKGSMQGSGSFLYGGAHVLGAGGQIDVGRGDQNFPAPAFLPVMQFGGQHAGGMGVPAMGMAFPGYVSQPQLGVGNSEMTWLPVLTGAAGALGASYCPPYITVDGAYHAPSSAQPTTSGSSSKESNTGKPNSEWKPSQATEAASEENGQRQNKPRRYSEMNFGQ